MVKLSSRGEEDAADKRLHVEAKSWHHWLKLLTTCLQVYRAILVPFSGKFSCRNSQPIH
jgi:hypothetical protein